MVPFLINHVADLELDSVSDSQSDLDSALDSGSDSEPASGLDSVQD